MNRELERFKKIAGLLKEDDLDLSDTPTFGANMTSIFRKAGIDLGSVVYVLREPGYRVDIQKPEDVIRDIEEEEEVAEQEGEVYYGDYEEWDSDFLRREGVPSSAELKLTVVLPHDTFSIFQ